jgi:histidinol-phosphate aminotransferase
MSQWPEWLPLVDRLAGLSPYGAPQVPAEATLNTNENPYSLSPTLAKAIATRIEESALHLNRYPDRDASRLRAGLADFINSQSATEFTVDNIWAANGSNEIIQSLFLAFGKNGAIGFVPSYSMHPLIAQVIGCKWHNGARREDFSLDITVAQSEIRSHAPSLTFITTPNNPTGTSLSIAEILKIADVSPGLVVVDEAYAEFSDEQSAVTLIAKNPKIVVIRTMSKAFSFAGARVGYLVADPVVIRALFLVRLPYHLSSLTQAAAEVALAHQSELLENVEKLITAREEMRHALKAMGLTVVPSKANFLLFSGFDIPAAQLWQKLLDMGVLIRDVGLSGHLRVTVGNEAENKLFIESLTEAIG